MWTETRKYELKELIVGGRLSWDAAAAILTDRWGVAVTGTAARMTGRRMGLKSNFEATGAAPVPVPPPIPARFTDAWTLPEGDGWMLCGDWHAPFTDWQMVGRLAAVAQQRKIKRLLIAGDLFNFDAFGHHPAIITGSTADADTAAARWAVQWCLDVFSEVWITSGNHDLWLARDMGGKFGAASLANLMLHLCDGEKYPDRVRWSIYSHAHIDSPVSGRWRISHPGSYSRTRGATAAALAAKFATHVISFHEHHLAATVSPNGRHCAYACGCLVDPDKLAYVRLVDSTAPEMVQGFASLQNGVATLYGGPVGFTHWDAIAPESRDSGAIATP